MNGTSQIFYGACAPLIPVNPKALVYMPMVSKLPWSIFKNLYQQVQSASNALLGAVSYMKVLTEQSEVGNRKKESINELSENSEEIHAYDSWLGAVWLWGSTVNETIRKYLERTRAHQHSSQAFVMLFQPLSGGLSTQIHRWMEQRTKLPWRHWYEPVVQALCCSPFTPSSTIQKSQAEQYTSAGGMLLLRLGEVEQVSVWQYVLKSSSGGVLDFLYHTRMMPMDQFKRKTIPLLCALESFLKMTRSLDNTRLDNTQKLSHDIEQKRLTWVEQMADPKGHWKYWLAQYPLLRHMDLERLEQLWESSSNSARSARSCIEEQLNILEVEQVPLSSLIPRVHLSYLFTQVQCVLLESQMQTKALASSVECLPRRL